MLIFMNMRFVNVAMSFLALSTIAEQIVCAELCKEQCDLTETNQSLEFSMVSRKNQTGHWITHFAVEKSSSRLPNNWKVNFKNSLIKTGGVQTFNVLGTIIVPPPRPVDFEFFPNIGYYKFYPETKVTFDEALVKCSNDGGHLAIINSHAEYYAIQTIFSRYPKAGPWAFIGFHDRFNEGEYITIFGKPLNSTGFVKWYPGDPNNWGNSQDCGCIARDSFLCDISCEEKYAFFCEFDLSWGDF